MEPLEAQARVGVPDSCVRFEARGKEFGSVARLIPEAIAKANAPQAMRELRAKVRQVTGPVPETGRSSPWEGEIPRKGDGGSLPMLRFKSLGSPGARGKKPIESGNSWFLPKCASAQPRRRQDTG